MNRTLEPVPVLPRDGVPCAICLRPFTDRRHGNLCADCWSFIPHHKMTTWDWAILRGISFRFAEPTAYSIGGVDRWRWDRRLLIEQYEVQAPLPPRQFIEHPASVLSYPREDWLAPVISNSGQRSDIDKQSWIALGYGPAQSFGPLPTRWRAASWLPYKEKKVVVVDERLFETGTRWHDLMPPALPSFAPLERVRAEHERSLDWLEACAREWVQQGRKSVQTSLLADGIRIQTGRAGKSEGIPYISRALGDRALGEWTYVPLENLRWYEQRQREAWLSDAEAFVSVQGLLDGLTYASLNWDRDVAARLARHPSLLRSRLSLPELLARTASYREPKTQLIYCWQHTEGYPVFNISSIGTAEVRWCKANWNPQIVTGTGTHKQDPNIHVHFQERLHQGGYLRKAFDEDGLLYTNTKNWTTKPKHKPLDELQLIGARENTPRWQHVNVGDYEHSRQLQRWTTLKARSDAALVDRYEVIIRAGIRPARTSITCAQCGVSVERILWPGLELRPHWECPDCKPDVGDEVHGSSTRTPTSRGDMNAQLATSIEDSAVYQVENDSDYDRDYDDVDYDQPHEVNFAERGTDEHVEAGSQEFESAPLHIGSFSQGEDVASKVIGRNPSLRTLESDPEVKRLQAQLSKKLMAGAYYDPLHDKRINRRVDGHPICFRNKNFLADKKRPEVRHHLLGEPWSRIGRRDVKSNTKAKDEERRIAAQSEFDTAHAECLAEHFGETAIFALVKLDKLRPYRLNVDPFEQPGPERWKKIEEEIGRWYGIVLKENLRKRGSKSEREVREHIRKAFKAVAVRSVWDNYVSTPSRNAPDPDEYECPDDD